MFQSPSLLNVWLCVDLFPSLKEETFLMTVAEGTDLESFHHFLKDEYSLFLPLVSGLSVLWFLVTQAMPSMGSMSRRGP